MRFARNFMLRLHPPNFTSDIAIEHGQAWCFLHCLALGCSLVLIFAHIFARARDRHRRAFSVCAQRLKQWSGWHGLAASVAFSLAAVLHDRLFSMPQIVQQLVLVAVQDLTLFSAVNVLLWR